MLVYFLISFGFMGVKLIVLLAIGTIKTIEIEMGHLDLYPTPHLTHNKSARKRPLTNMIS